MPRLSAWAIRAALVYLGMGFTLGALLLANKGLPFSAPLSMLTWRLFPAHVEFLLVGWTAQLALGVAFWILPRFTHGPKRGNEGLAWLALGLLNLGVWLVACGPLAAALTLAGRIAEAGAALAFGVASWRRVRPTGSG